MTDTAVLREFATTTRRYAAGTKLAEGDFAADPDLAARRVALVEGGYLPAPPKAERAKPAAANAAA